jgi:uncharacterized protein (DUF697 family)/GTP-binding protein EngB required for normal cell division
MDLDQFQQKLDQEYQDFKSKVEKPNILLIGGTGVGKSSLINTCFGSELAQVGVGKPVTQHMDSYACDSVPVVLFDSKGYEIGSDKEKDFLNDVIDYVTSPKDTTNSIHIAWYCIAASATRIVDFDINTINQIKSSGVPIAIVLTKSDLLSEEDSKSFKNEIKNKLPEIAIFETTTNEKLNNLELSDLCQWSVDNLSIGLRLGFVSAQRKNINLKREESRKVIVQHSTSNAFIGFTPIPFSDAPILLTSQAAMIARILFIYDIGSLSDVIKDLVGGVAIGSLVSESGIWIVGQLLKFIPGIGTVAGGIINGSVAASLTYAIGFAVSELCAKLSEATLTGDSEKIKEFLNNISNFFSTELLKNFKLKQKES